MRFSYKLALLINICLLGACHSNSNTPPFEQNGQKDSAKLLNLIDSLPLPQEPILGYLTITTPVLKIRKEHNTQSHIVDRIYEGDSCNILEKGECRTPIDGHLDYWYRIHHKGSEGWIYGGYTSIAQQKPSYTEASFHAIIDSIPNVKLPLKWSKYSYEAPDLDVGIVAQYLKSTVDECQELWGMTVWRFAGKIPFTKDIHIILYIRGTGVDCNVYLGTYTPDGRIIAKLDLAYIPAEVLAAYDDFRIDQNFNIIITKPQFDNNNSVADIHTEKYSILPNGKIQKQ
ncbi:MAG: SH3 domain-containing protein [Aureispira sp.]|nr:SH3 domain-containing protein [Aureispira sp.]